MAAVGPQPVSSVARREATLARTHVSSTSRLKVATEGVFESPWANVRTPSPFVRRLCLHCSVLAIALVASVVVTLFG
jgi:hypothetical protein